MSPIRRDQSDWPRLVEDQRDSIATLGRAPAAQPGRSRALRLVHYWWPVIMGGSTVAVVARATARRPDTAGSALLLFGILTAYSLDRLQHDGGRAFTRTLRVALWTGTGVGFIGTALLLVVVPFRTAMLVPVLGAVVMAYSRLKALPLLKTVLVSAAWTWGLIAFPFHDESWLGWHAWAIPLTIPLMALFASGCLLCDLKDERDDRRASVATLPVLVGVRGTVVAAVALAVIGGAAATVQHRLGLTIGGAGLVIAALHPTVLSDDIFGPLLVDVILTLPGFLIVCHAI